MKVAIIFGSLSDKEVMAKAGKILDEFEVPYQAYAISAHRIPEVLTQKLTDFEKEGVEVIIAGAGLAAHLPGVIASKTTTPVIGVPLKGALEGLDSLYSIVQMPKDIPVATVGINNARNAGMLAIEILAIKHSQYKEKLRAFRSKMKETLSNQIEQSF